VGDEQGSVSFDRAAEFYDATREVDDEAFLATLELLTAELNGRGRVLEFGVGTGVLALPLAERGLDVVGVDLSSAMMAKLHQKADGRAPFPLLRADATRLPFRDGGFGAAYGRHVLHLIPGWRTVVAELCRVVGRGVVLIDAGGNPSAWHDVWLAMREVLGPEADHVGLDMARDGEDQLVAAFVAAGAVPRPLPEIPFPDEDTVATYLEEVARRSPSWTWRVPDDQLRDAIEVARRWTLDRFDTLDVRLNETGSVRWKAFDVGSAAQHH
jgi:SAM-dependent methyltransferase